MNFSILRIQSLVGLLALCVMLGCKGEDFGTVPVGGTVTMDDKPLVGVEVSFFPEPTKETSIVGPFSAGVTDSQGKFELRTRYDEPGAVVGKHRVSFQYEGFDEEEMDSAIASVREAKASGEDTSKAKAAYEKAKSSSKGKTRIPNRYTDNGSEVYYDVPAGGADDVLFELTSQR